MYIKRNGMRNPLIWCDIIELYGYSPQTCPQLVFFLDRHLSISYLFQKNMVKVCSNAMKQYIRSRPAPASESIKRFKEMNRDGILVGNHPIFGKLQQATYSDNSLPEQM